MATYTELMMKMADGRTLDPIEREQLRQYTTEIDNNRQIVSTWQQVNKKIDSQFLDLPVSVIYSNTLVSSASSISLVIPQTFNHLMIFSSGRVGAPNTDPPYAIKVRFNGSSTDYSYQFIRALDTTLSGAKSTETFGYLGMFLSGVAADGDMSNISFIANYRGAFNKTIHTFIGSGERVDFFTSVWDNTDPIRTMEIFAATTLSTGSSFSIVGIK